ncbi:MAG: hypothetical protein LBP35_01175 [Candidatus Ancillula trichonymphae]|nr:hypothetical protein [Candidatus Ancillula trichonymphae]
MVKPKSGGAFITKETKLPDQTRFEGASIELDTDHKGGSAIQKTLNSITVKARLVELTNQSTEYAIQKVSPKKYSAPSIYAAGAEDCPAEP